jgi:hypothetical protein
MEIAFHVLQKVIAALEGLAGGKGKLENSGGTY